MHMKISDIVRSVNGRDAGKMFFVIGLEGEYALIADGKGRRLEKPKRKKAKHVSFVSGSDSRAAVKLRTGERTTNSELRRALAEFRSAGGGEEGGM